MMELTNRHERAHHPLAVVAMGGHAFIQAGEEPTHETHERNAAHISGMLMTLVERDYNLVITHGNGPQVGQLMRQSDLTRDEVPQLPLDVLVSHTEGWLGYVLQQALLNQLRRRRIQRYVVTMVTQVVVDPNDPAFGQPTKPVGHIMDRQSAEACQRRFAWEVAEVEPGKFRRVVPAPEPKRVVQWRMVRDAVRQGHIVIAGGGGGIPIIKNTQDDYQGVEAVIDKDLSSSLLAASIGAEVLIILTAVPQVFVNFRQPDQRALGAVTLEEASRLVGEGHFPAGSMGPKVEAVLNFLRTGGRRGLVTDPTHLAAALEGHAGTHFVGRL